MAETRVITIRINGFTTKLSIPAEREEVYRKAAKVEITELKTNYERLKLAKAYGWDEKSKREANNRITKLVRDIDKCLGLLNEID